MVMVTSNHKVKELPLVVILADADPMAGDLAAILSGRFRVKRLHGVAEAMAHLAFRPAALIVVSEDRGYPDLQYQELYRGALKKGCRVMVLGDSGPEMELPLRARIQLFSRMPSPVRIMNGLKGLGALAES